MVRISEILKIQPQPAMPKTVADTPKAGNFSRLMAVSPAIPHIPISPSVIPPEPVILAAPAENEGVLYAQLLAHTQRCLERMRQEERIELGYLPSLSEQLIESMIGGSTEFLRMAIVDEQQATLAQHAVNVSILMVQVGMELELNRGLIQDLAMVGLLHDVGMVKFEHLMRIPGAWKGDQMEHVREHPQWSQRVISAQAGLPKFISRIAVQEHERKDGSGYPFGISGASLDEFGQLLGLLDMYEALVHDRPFRERLLPTAAMRLLIQNHRSLFSDRTFKSFLNAVPVYPAGSWVQLSTGERAKVIAHNRSQPFSPTVMISRFDADAAGIKRETVDLSRQRGVTVAGAIAAPPKGDSRQAQT